MISLRKKTKKKPCFRCRFFSLFVYNSLPFLDYHDSLCNCGRTKCCTCICFLDWKKMEQFFEDLFICSSSTDMLQSLDLNQIQIFLQEVWEFGFELLVSFQFGLEWLVLSEKNQRCNVKVCTPMLNVLFETLVTAMRVCSQNKWSHQAMKSFNSWGFKIKWLKASNNFYSSINTKSNRKI